MYRSKGLLRSEVESRVHKERWWQLEQQVVEAARRQKLIDRIHELDVVVEARWVLLEEKARKEAELEIKLAIIAQFQKKAV